MDLVATRFDVIQDELPGFATEYRRFQGVALVEDGDLERLNIARGIPGGQQIAV